MRVILGTLTLLLVGSLVVVQVRSSAMGTARTETIAEIQRTLDEATSRVARYARSAERVLSPLPVMTPGDEQALRRYRNASHVARARQIGVRVESRAASDSLLDTGRLVELEDSTRYWIVRRGTGAYVVPELRALLELIGARFHERLAALGLPAFRLEITSALRTAEQQADLRRTNTNAAAGVSSHEFGTTVDVSYAAFAPPLEVPDPVLDGAMPELSSHLERFADLALESVSARKSRELGAILSQVLIEAQAEGLALVIYERQQTVYHLTVASADVGSAN